MKVISKRRSKELRKLNKVYDELALEREHKCTGCGRYDVPLSHSHLIPRSRRKDLITNKKNITYHCLSMGKRKGCHSIWETSDRVTLLDYFDNLETIKELDIDYYNLINID